ncbi:MAG: helix-turn-helix domain-containing protein [Chitinispirillales bacterium]|jgi:phage terminase Nu1 subunit (DNA packaging protein)|nr:helix-turn-helix domain-containing protein [Chitinispirillales bacterium]
MEDEKQILINTKEVAELTGMSVSWVTKWRHRIIGARRMGRVWRFEKTKIMSRIAAGKKIVD